MASGDEMTIAQFALKLDTMIAEFQRKLDLKFETIHKCIDNLETSRNSSKKSRGKQPLNESSDSDVDIKLDDWEQ